MNWNRSTKRDFETKSTLTNEVDLAMQHVITTRDYGTCPTIKSNNAIKTMIVVKSDGNSHSIETRTNYSDSNHNEPLESRTLGMPLQ